MRNLAGVSVLVFLAACQNPDPGAYHVAAAHPYRVTEEAVRLQLPEGDVGIQETARFASERPNNGSSFIISAPEAMIGRLRSAVIATGVSPSDIRVVPDGTPAQVARIDRVASVPSCTRPPQEKTFFDYLFKIEDGFERDNSNASLLGCAIRRNIVDMTDDPRSLSQPVENGAGRDGKVGARTYDKWSTGASPASGITLPSWSTR